MSIRSLATTLLAAVLAAPCALAQDAPSYAVRAGKIYPVADDQPHVIEDGIMVVRDGVIVALGPADSIEVPHDLTLLDYRHATIMPGIVAASTNIAGSHNGDESISGMYRAVDAFDRYGEFNEYLAAGITTAHLDPGTHRLVSGRGAVVQLGGYYDERVLNDNADLAVNLVPQSLNPPDLQHWLVPPTGDQPVTPSTIQRPSSRLGQYLALREAINATPNGVDVHLQSFQSAWNAQMPLRLSAQRTEDLLGAMRFLGTNQRAGYVVGGIEAVGVADALRRSGLALVYTIDSPVGSAGTNLGGFDALSSNIDDLAHLQGVNIALATTAGASPTDLRLLGATALRAGWSEQQVLSALTRTPAEILGVADRVGSLEPGKHADFLVLSGEPLATRTHINRAYINEHLVHRSDLAREAVVVRAGTIWLGPDNWLTNGSILIEDGRITAVGRSVPHPPGAQLIDAGEDAFITPGFIDGHGHLGLDGDRGTLPPQLSLAGLIGAPDLHAERVSRAGVTTVVTSPYGFHNNGSQVTAIKTAGDSREARVIDTTSAVAFSVAGMDPEAIQGRLKGRIDAGRKYLETWQKYEEELEAWKAERAAGKTPTEDAGSNIEETESTGGGASDPITGTWEVRVSGGPLPQEFQGKVAFRLTGNQIEGRVIEPTGPIEHRILGTLTGTKMSGVIEVDTGGMGQPTWQGEITEPDVMSGSISLATISANFEARRIDKSAVEFKVMRSKRRTTGPDGRPLPPRVNETLEPIRAWLEKRIPALIQCSTTQEIEAVLDYLVDSEELPVILLGAPNASYVAERIRDAQVGVIVPAEIMSTRDRQPYHAADDLTRRGVSVAFQSDAEDGARLLPLVGLHAVERGMSAEQALAAFTIDAARMYMIDDRVGSITTGRDGDLVIFSGHPFETSSRVLRVIVNGREVNN